MLGKLFGNGKTVLRGGYGRIFGRLNGVDLVLVPLLGPGLLQGVTCVNPLINGTCAGSGVATPANAFRIGTDGLIGSSGVAAPPRCRSRSSPARHQSGNAWTPIRSIRISGPTAPINFTLTIQREINPHMTGSRLHRQDHSGTSSWK